MAETCGRVPALEHDGSVYACDHFVEPEHFLGNVSSDGLDAIVGSPALLAFARAKRDALPARCRDCPVLFLCNGGCPKDRLAAAPEGGGALSYLCAGYRRFYGHALPHLERMVALARAGREPGAIMVELEVGKREARAALRTARRNDPCPCGSGTKYKHCCSGTLRR